MQGKNTVIHSLVDSLSEFPTASKKWCNVTKELIGKKSSDSVPSLQNFTGEYICNDVGKCNMFNRCFASQSSVDDRNADLPDPLLCTDATLDNLFVDEEEVRKVICDLNVSKAMGPDGIGNRFIKELVDSILTPLTEFYNYSLEYGVFPSKWKRYNIMPLFKKGDKTVPMNYRPVSLLSCLSKVFEKLVASK
jgi:hypothetical protein